MTGFSIPSRIRLFAIGLLSIMAWPCLAATLAVPTPAARALVPIQELVRSGQIAQAESLARILLVATERRSGRSSLDVADVLDVLVESLWRGGRNVGSEGTALAQRAVAIRERLQGRDAPDLAKSLGALGATLYTNGDYQAARPVFERTLRIRERALGPEAIEVASTLNNLGRSGEKPVIRRGRQMLIAAPSRSARRC